MKKHIITLFKAKPQKCMKKTVKLYHLFLKSGEIKKRSHSHAVTDWVYCLEPPGSPWPAAVGFPGVPGSKSSQLLHGSDFLF